jgi:hypothetical protein
MRCRSLFKVALSRLVFFDEPLRSRLQSVEDSPILGRQFNSSVPGLYFIGVAAANSFGPPAEVCIRC